MASTSFWGHTSRKNRCEKFPVMEFSSVLHFVWLQIWVLIWMLGIQWNWTASSRTSLPKTAMKLLEGKMVWLHKRERHTRAVMSIFSTKISTVPKRPLTSCVHYYYCHRYCCGSNTPFSSYKDRAGYSVIWSIWFTCYSKRAIHSVSFPYDSELRDLFVIIP